MLKQSPHDVFVFVDDDPLWHSFHQVAALVRRNGYRAVRVTTAETGRLGRLADRLLYWRAYYLSGMSELGTLAALLEPFAVTQMYVTEPVMAHLPDRLFDDLPPTVAADLRRRMSLSNKREAARIAAERGIRVPDQLPASLVAAAVAVEKLGLPLVVKTTMGAAGSGVRIAATVDDVECAASRLGPSADVFYERYIPGQIVSYAAMMSAGDVVQEMTYEAVKSSSNPTSAPLAFEVIDDRELVEIGRKVCQGLGILGPVNMQAIRDSTGDYWVIDLNVRPYGTMLCYDQREFDTAAAYLYSTPISDIPPIRRTATPGVQDSRHGGGV